MNYYFSSSYSRLGQKLFLYSAFALLFFVLPHKVFADCDSPSCTKSDRNICLEYETGGSYDNGTQCTDPAGMRYCGSGFEHRSIVADEQGTCNHTCTPSQRCYYIQCFSESCGQCCFGSGSPPSNYKIMGVFNLDTSAPDGPSQDDPAFDCESAGGPSAEELFLDVVEGNVHYHVPITKSCAWESGLPPHYDTKDYVNLTKGKKTIGAPRNFVWKGKYYTYVGFKNGSDTSMTPCTSPCRITEGNTCYCPPDPDAADPIILTVQVDGKEDIWFGYKEFSPHVPECSAITGPDQYYPNQIYHFNTIASHAGHKEIMYDWDSSACFKDPKEEVKDGFVSVHTIKIRARGEYGVGDWPDMDVYVARPDIGKVCSYTVDNSKWKIFTCNLEPAAKLQPHDSIDIVFPNDRATSESDRNLFVDYIEVDGIRLQSESNNPNGIKVIYDRGVPSSVDSWFDGMDYDYSREAIGGKEGMYHSGALRFPVPWQAPNNCSDCTIYSTVYDRFNKGNTCSKTIKCLQRHIKVNVSCDQVNASIVNGAPSDQAQISLTAQDYYGYGQKNDYTSVFTVTGNKPASYQWQVPEYPHDYILHNYFKSTPIVSFETSNNWSGPDISQQVTLDNCPSPQLACRSFSSSPDHPIVMTPVKVSFRPDLELNIDKPYPNYSPFLVTRAEFSVDNGQTWEQMTDDDNDGIFEGQFIPPEVRDYNIIARFFVPDYGWFGKEL